MVKKVERAKDKVLSSAHQDVQDEGSKSPEPYYCTGKFHDDFTELATRAGMLYPPAVQLRPKRPGTPPPPPEVKPEKGGKEKGGKDKQQAAAAAAAPPPAEPEQAVDERGEPAEPPPKTYVTRDRFEYFKPSVQVEMENPDKRDTVTEVFVRGWKIDAPMMNIFKQCWCSMEKLHMLSLWNVGLTDETLALLASFLPQCPNLRTATIEGNTPPVSTENWHVLVKEDSQLLHLTLRHNGITDIGAALIAQALGGLKSSNSKLLSLNLAGNSITDVGARHLANALRMNRTLLTLGLAGNHIGDVGAKALGEALSKFPLMHEEVVERRRLLSEKGLLEHGKSPPPSRRADSKDRPGSHRSSSHLAKSQDKRDKSSKKKNEKEEPKDKGKGQKGKEQEKPPAGKKQAAGAGAEAAAKPAAKGTKDKKAGKGDKKGAASLEPEPEMSDVISPLLEHAELIDVDLWLNGNRVLLSLSLQRNQIGENGVKALLDAMQYQDRLMLEGPKPAQGTGLMRLALNKNCVDQKSEDLQKLCELMAKRDPFYKPTQDDETASAITEKGR